MIYYRLEFNYIPPLLVTDRPSGSYARSVVDSLSKEHAVVTSYARLTSITRSKSLNRARRVSKGGRTSGGDTPYHHERDSSSVYNNIAETKREATGDDRANKRLFINTSNNS